MSLGSLLSIFGFLFDILFTALAFIYNIQLTDNIKFGPVCVIFLIFFIVLYIMFKPFRKD